MSSVYFTSKGFRVEGLRFQEHVITFHPFHASEFLTMEGPDLCQEIMPRPRRPYMGSFQKNILIPSSIQIMLMHSSEIQDTSAHESG